MNDAANGLSPGTKVFRFFDGRVHEELTVRKTVGRSIFVQEHSFGLHRSEIKTQKEADEWTNPPDIVKAFEQHMKRALTVTERWMVENAYKLGQENSKKEND